MLCTFLENIINLSYIAVRTSMKVESFVSRMVYRLYSLVWSLAFNGPLALLSFAILSIKNMIDNILAFVKKLKKLSDDMKSKGKDTTKIIPGYADICQSVLECRPLVEFFIVGSGDEAPMGISLVPGLYPESEDNNDYWLRYNKRMKNRLMYFDSFINDVKSEISAKSYDDLIDDFLTIKKQKEKLKRYRTDLDTYIPDLTTEPTVKPSIQESLFPNNEEQNRFYFADKIRSNYFELLSMIFSKSNSFWVSKNISELDNFDSEYNTRIIQKIILPAYPTLNVYTQFNGDGKKIFDYMFNKHIPNEAVYGYDSNGVVLPLEQYKSDFKKIIDISKTIIEYLNTETKLSSNFIVNSNDPSWIQTQTQVAIDNLTNERLGITYSYASEIFKKIVTYYNDLNRLSQTKYIMYSPVDNATPINNSLLMSRFYSNIECNKKISELTLLIDSKTLEEDSVPTPSLFSLATSNSSIISSNNEEVDILKSNRELYQNKIIQNNDNIQTASEQIEYYDDQLSLIFMRLILSVLCGGLDLGKLWKTLFSLLKTLLRMLLNLLGTTAITSPIKRYLSQYERFIMRKKRFADKYLQKYWVRNRFMRKWRNANKKALALIDAVSKCVTANCDVFDPKYDAIKNKASGAGYFQTGDGIIDPRFWTWSYKALPFVSSLETNLASLSSIKTDFFSISDRSYEILNTIIKDLNNPTLEPESVIDNLANRLLSIANDYNLLFQNVQNTNKKLKQSFTDLTKDEQIALTNSGNSDQSVQAEKQSNVLSKIPSNQAAESSMNSVLTPQTNPEISTSVPARP